MCTQEGRHLFDIIFCLYEGELKSFRPQLEDSSTRKYKLVNFVVHLLTVTHQSFSHFELLCNSRLSELRTKSSIELSLNICF